MISTKTGFLAEVRELSGYHELIRNLVRKELKVKYKNSILGFLWTLLNPLFSLIIFTVVFRVLLKFGIPFFAFYLLSGLLAWNFFTMGLSTATQSVVANSSLVTKVYFPRKALPLSAVGASAYHFFFQFVVLLGAMAIFRYFRFWDSSLLLFPLAFVVEVILVSALALVLASLNVYVRDIQHLLELALLAWFWFTPIVYASAWIRDRLTHFPAIWGLYLANPMTGIVLAFQRALYSQIAPLQAETPGAKPKPFPVLIDAPITWYYSRLLYVAIGSIILFVVCWRTFSRLEWRLAEEL